MSGRKAGNKKRQEHDGGAQPAAANTGQPGNSPQGNEASGGKSILDNNLVMIGGFVVLAAVIIGLGSNPEWLGIGGKPSPSTVTPVGVTTIKETDKGTPGDLSYRFDLSPAEALRDYIRQTKARKEFVGASRLKVEHILIKADDNMTPANRSAAEDRVARLLRQVKENPASFSNLRRTNSEDPGEGVYSMVAAGTPARQGVDYDRKTMVPAFGDVAWRLKVGEIGVAGPHASDSPFGYHIIMRVE